MENGRIIFKRFAPSEPTKRKLPDEICQNCKKLRVNRPRLLCWGCYYTPGVKDRFPSTSKYARRGLGNGYKNSEPPLPELPTLAPPQSAEKERVLCERLQTGKSLWHPYDARWENDKRTLAYIAAQMGYIDPELVPAIKKRDEGEAFSGGTQIEENHGGYGGSVRRVSGS